jgi:hypothetical protein
MGYEISIDPQASTSILDGEIDRVQWVAARQLVGLPKDEVKIVEGR